MQPRPCSATKMAGKRAASSSRPLSKKRWWHSRCSPTSATSRMSSVAACNMHAPLVSLTRLHDLRCIQVSQSQLQWLVRTCQLGRVGRDSWMGCGMTGIPICRRRSCDVDRLNACAQHHNLVQILGCTLLGGPQSRCRRIYRRWQTNCGGSDAASHRVGSLKLCCSRASRSCTGYR
jgi:hypothetical protein